MMNKDKDIPMLQPQWKQLGCCRYIRNFTKFVSRIEKGNKSSLRRDYSLNFVLPYHN